MITTTNTFVINQDDIGTDTRDPNVAKIGGSGGGSGRRSMGRVKPLTSRKKHLLLLEEQHAFMTHLHQIRDRRVEGNMHSQHVHAWGLCGITQCSLFIQDHVHACQYMGWGGRRRCGDAGHGKQSSFLK